MDTQKLVPEFNFDRQQQLETQALAEGAKRFRRAVEDAEARGEGGTVGAARQLLARAIEPTQTAIEYWMANRTTGPVPVSLKWAEAVGADVLAYMTARTILDGITERASIRRTALDIAGLVADELRYRRFQSECPGLFQYRMSTFRTSSYAHMSRSMNATLSYAEIDVSDLDMPQDVRLHLGYKAIDLFVQATGLVTVESKRVGKGGKRPTFVTEQFLQPTPETMAWLQARNGALENLWPVHLPMVVPPLPWTVEKRGGYRYALLGKHPMVRGASEAHTATLAAANMPMVYAALNRIQETAWRINANVVQLLDLIINKRGGVAGVPSLEPIPEPHKPADIDTNEDSLRAWKKRRHASIQAEIQRKYNVLGFSRTLDVARLMQGEAAIWFPHNVDFRGRVYPIATYLSPQGDDLSRGLLTLAQGQPIGKDGPRWLAYHLANCMGATPAGEKVSKMTMRDRYQWVVDHSDMIVAAAEDPFGASWWLDGEKPLQLWAACVEWAGYLHEGEAYVCSLPCAMDGTCNGLQHLSAMRLDEVGGKAVNLLPTLSANQTPEDVYSYEADAVTQQLTADAGESWFARQWLASGLVNRKLVKRQTMTVGYSATKYGFVDQLVEYLRGLDNYAEVVEHFTNDEGEEQLHSACMYMAGVIWDTLAITVAGAFELMRWFQGCSRAITKDGNMVEWIVPATGFHVRQEYVVDERVQIKTMLAGSICRPRVYHKTDKVDTVHQANGIAPNVVHSMDAAALMLTVVAASNAGVEGFHMIHDSYAAVPADCAILARALREAFVTIYSQDLVGNLAAQFQQQTTQDIPEVPTKGSLDISGVLASDYFFA